jgi:hypothetical protein
VTAAFYSYIWTNILHAVHDEYGLHFITNPSPTNHAHPSDGHDLLKQRIQYCSFFNLLMPRGNFTHHQV